MSRKTVGRLAAVITVAALWTVGTLAVRADDAEKPWERSIAVGLAVTTGNSDSLQFNAGIKGEKIWKADELRLGANGTYGKTDGNVANEVLRGGGQYKHLFNERLYGTVIADVLHDGVANIEYRFILGPGVGYYFIKSPKTKLGADIGPSYVFEKTDVTHPNQPLPPNPDYVTSDTRDYLAVRVGERFEHQLNDTAKCWQQTEWLPRVEDFSDYLLITEAGIEAALTKTLSLRVVGTHRYESVTADTRRHYDITLVSALAYKF